MRVRILLGGESRVTLRRRGLWIGLGVVALFAVVLLAVVFVVGRMMAADGQRISLRDDVLEIELRVPDGLGITTVHTAAAESECSTISYGFERKLTVESIGAACELSDPTRIFNGHHGDYRSIDDVADPRDIDEVDTPIGSAVVFTQTYSECTNYCRDWDEPVAIVTLDDPASEAHGSVVVRGDKAEISRDELVEILESLRPLDGFG